MIETLKGPLSAKFYLTIRWSLKKASKVYRGNNSNMRPLKSENKKSRFWSALKVNSYLMFWSRSTIFTSIIFMVRVRAGLESSDSKTFKFWNAQHSFKNITLWNEKTLPALFHSNVFSLRQKFWKLFVNFFFI